MAGKIKRDCVLLSNTDVLCTSARIKVPFILFNQFFFNRNRLVILYLVLLDAKALFQLPLVMRVSLKRNCHISYKFEVRCGLWFSSVDLSFAT